MEIGGRRGTDDIEIDVELNDGKYGKLSTRQDKTVGNFFKWAGQLIWPLTHA